MAKDLMYLANRMPKIAEAIEKDVGVFVADIALRVHYNVVEMTPVDVGTARSNWIARNGSPWSFVYRAFAPGKFLGRAEGSNLGAAVAQAQGVVSRRKTDEDIYFTNNLPYIQRLNAGWSKQSAAGFVQRGIQAGISEGISGFKWPNLRRLK